VTSRRQREEGPLRAFIEELHERSYPVARVPGTAVFLNRSNETAPLAMRESVEHLHALCESVVILSIETHPVPHVRPADRLTIDDLGHSDDGITHVGARFGYMDAADVPATLAQIDQEQLEVPFDAGDASYFLSTIELCISDEPGMSRWRKHLFVATSRVTADAAEYFHLPRERTVIIGSRIEV
jgi:KUP system potassium uptake protein